MVRPSHLVTGKVNVGASFKGWVLLKDPLNQRDVHFEGCRPSVKRQPVIHSLSLTT